MAAASLAGNLLIPQSPRVEHEEIREAAERETPVQPNLGARASPNGHPFEIRAVGGSLPNLPVTLARVVISGTTGPGIVGQFVVVPDNDERVLTMDSLQIEDVAGSRRWRWSRRPIGRPGSTPATSTARSLPPTSPTQCAERGRWAGRGSTARSPTRSPSSTTSTSSPIGVDHRRGELRRAPRRPVDRREHRRSGLRRLAAHARPIRPASTSSSSAPAERRGRSPWRRHSPAPPRSPSSTATPPRREAQRTCSTSAPRRRRRTCRGTIRTTCPTPSDIVINATSIGLPRTSTAR